MNMKKFPSVKYPGDSATDGLTNKEVVVTEKMDGANFRWTWQDGQLLIGTRNVVYEDPQGENVANAFQHAIDYVQETVSDLPASHERYTFFGEAMHLHSLDYEDIDWETPNKGSPHVPLDSEKPNVVVFDAYDNEVGNWVSWEQVEALAADYGFELAPVLGKGDLETVDFDVPEESVFGGEPEGIIVRRVDGQVRAKKVTDSFKEKNAVAFNDTSKAQTDAGQFVSGYVTDARIEKCAHKLVDEGEYESLCMDMMEDLPRFVLSDAVEENGWELLTSESPEFVWNDDFKGEVRSKASKKCARTLKGMMQQL